MISRFHRHIVAAAAISVGMTASAEAGKRPVYRTAPCCPPATLPGMESAPYAQPAQPEQPGQADQAMPAPQPEQEPSQNIDDLLSSSSETASSPQTTTPYMMGDLFGLGGNFFLGFTDSNGDISSANNSTPVNGGRRFKIGESVSPMPRDRVFFNYNMFRGPYRTEVPSPFTPILGQPDTFPEAEGPSRGAKNFDLHRFTFGLEKTFFDGRASIEARIPFAQTLSSDLSITDSGAIPGSYATEFDNIPVTFKALLLRRERAAISTGLVINTPTADGINISQNFNNTVTGIPIGHRLTIDNDSWHLSPFIGYLFNPTDKLFVQGFFQYDFGVNGNDVSFTPVNGGVEEPTQRDVLDDQRLWQFDIAAGYWVYQNPNANWIRGIAPVVELHYTTTADNADILRFANENANYSSRVGNTLNRLDIVNLTLGTAMQIGDRGNVSAGFAVPLNRGDHNFLFSWEFLLQFNYRFGPMYAGPQAPIYNF